MPPWRNTRRYATGRALGLHGVLLYSLNETMSNTNKKATFGGQDSLVSVGLSDERFWVQTQMFLSKNSPVILSFDHLSPAPCTPPPVPPPGVLCDQAHRGAHGQHPPAHHGPRRADGV